MIQLIGFVISLTIGAVSFKIPHDILHLKTSDYKFWIVMLSIIIPYFIIAVIFSHKYYFGSKKVYCKKCKYKKDSVIL